MDVEELMQLGLSKTEAQLYLALLKTGASDVNSLIRETGIYKANTYQALERLCEKGIISKITDKGKRIYQIQPPLSLVELVKKKKYQVEQQEKLARKLSEQVKLLKKHTCSSETAAVMRGFAGVRQIYSEIVEKKLDYLAFGSPSESDNIGKFYWQNLHVKQKEYKIKAKMIFNNSLRHWKKMVPKDIIKLRFLAEEFEPLTETTIYRDKVAFVVWVEKPVVTIIQNEHVAQSYRQIFNMLWKQAKE